jgi:valyl-tRNA synthetase
VAKKQNQNQKNDGDKDKLPECEISPRCEPAAYEAKWTERWIEDGVFSKHPKDVPERFCMVIPPPNVTGSLHMGHALDMTIQDVLLRYNHLRGKDALWIPGTDHAGIATQNVVEKRLAAEGTDRHALGREKFVERVWQWKDEYHANITNQIRRMGAAVDWTRERFTLDEQCSKAVRTAFKQLFDEGLIYQGHRMINWCPRCKTALSDIEVEYEEEAGFLYHIKYPVKDSGEYLEIATTRPETLLGDSAVAVNPEDERYTKLHGKTCILPLVNREIPIIADAYVDEEFGTGALKITPAHDPNDFEIGKTHGLPQYVMLNEDGTISADYPAYAGMDRIDARKKIVEDLKAAGLFIKQELYSHSVGHCYRCGVAIEPYISLQWFVKMKELAAPAMQAVRDGRTRFVPEKWTKIYLDWLENIRDWCISRQLWWGHRIPVWDCRDCGTRSCAIEDLVKCPKCGSENIDRQEDVLDTWFSSGLWPLSTLGWPDTTGDFKCFYPTSVLVTGFDIIFFWVARMMFFGLKFGNDVPFRDVFIHGIVRDEKGKKMSKSSGNVIDPLEIVDELGADAMRFTFLYMGAMGQDVNVSAERFKTGRNFTNKLWNTARFVLMMAPEAPKKKIEELDPEKLGLADRWILTRAAALAGEVAEMMEAYNLNEAAQRIYSFVWRDFCDWYLELVKRPLREADPETAENIRSILHHILRMTLILLHPFIPFITEELWSKLPGAEGSILDAGYPSLKWDADAGAVADVEFMQEAVRCIRDIRANLNVPPSKKVEAVFLTHGDKKKKKALESGAGFIEDLAGVEKFTVDKPLAQGTRAMTAIALGVEIFVPFEASAVDDEVARLGKNEMQILDEIQRVERKLGDEKFVSKAPQHIVDKEREKMAGYKSDLKKIRERLALFGEAK